MNYNSTSLRRKNEWLLYENPCPGDAPSTSQTPTPASVGILGHLHDKYHQRFQGETVEQPSCGHGDSLRQTPSLCPHVPSLVRKRPLVAFEANGSSMDPE